MAAVIQGTIEEFLLNQPTKKRKLYLRWYNSKLLVSCLNFFTKIPKVFNMGRTSKALADLFFNSAYMFDRVDFSQQISSKLPSGTDVYHFSTLVERWMQHYKLILDIDGKDDYTKPYWIRDLLIPELEIKKNELFLESLRRPNVGIANQRINYVEGRFKEIEQAFADMIIHRDYRLNNPTYVIPKLTKQGFLNEVDNYVDKLNLIRSKLTYSKVSKEKKLLIASFFQLVAKMDLAADEICGKRKSEKAKRKLIEKYVEVFLLVKKGLEILENGLKLCEEYNSDLDSIYSSDNEMTGSQKIEKMLTIENNFQRELKKLKL